MQLFRLPERTLPIINVQYETAMESRQDAREEILEIKVKRENRAEVEAGSLQTYTHSY